MPVHAKAFSLLEAFAAIAIVAVLIALLVPALRFAREQADRAADLADLKTHVGVFSMYSADHDDLFPNFIDSRSGVGTLPGSTIRDFKYFDQVAFWHIPLYSSYYGGPRGPADPLPMGEEFYLKSAEGDLDGATLGRNPSYLYGATFLARPEYWNPLTRLAPPQQLGPVRFSEVNFPSAKAIFDAATRGGVLVSTPAAAAESDRDLVVLAGFVDGAAVAIREYALSPGVPNGPGFYPPWADGRYPGTFMGYTLDGVHGIDVKRR